MSAAHIIHVCRTLLKYRICRISFKLHIFFLEVGEWWKTNRGFCWFKIYVEIWLFLLFRRVLAQCFSIWFATTKYAFNFLIFIWETISRKSHSLWRYSRYTLFILNLNNNFSYFKELFPIKTFEFCIKFLPNAS